uniref:MULE transposase domain-containing protein n=1 Tax=Solanum lycopersicum TaxID=4081 RepID=A0A3Q7ECI1_SOLLC
MQSVVIYYQRKEKINRLFIGLLLSTIMNLHLQIVKKSYSQKGKKTDAQKYIIDFLDNSGVRPSKLASVLINQAGGVDRMNLTGQAIQNYLQTRRQKDLEKGDAQLMLQYFQRRQSENSGFFYAIQMDIDGRKANCFWVDARSRIAYKNFGEVVVFDQTYLTNKYKMPFVPFIGVNNHHQSVLFGCALL